MADETGRPEWLAIATNCKSIEAPMSMPNTGENIQISFDPTDAISLRDALARIAEDRRPSLISAAVKSMASDLAGINAVSALAAFDPKSFVTGLAVALRENPANLTAGRSLIWFCIRQGLFKEAVGISQQLGAHWEDHFELFVERLRILIVEGSGRADDYVKHNSRYFLKKENKESYILQSAVASGTYNGPRIQEKFSALGRSARADMIAAEVGYSGAERRMFSKFCSLIDTANSIALVGNAPTLRGSKLGKTIDDHDLVIRCNFPVVNEFYNDVGSRTDIMFFHESIRGQIPELVERSNRYLDCIMMGLHPDKDFVIDVDTRVVGHEYASTLPAETRQFLTDICYARSTTGLMGILLLCIVFSKKVAIFGFNFFSSSSSPHYFSENTGVYLGHEIQYEKWYVEKFLPVVLPNNVIFY